LDPHVKRNHLLLGLLAWYGLLWIVLAVGPRDRQDWFLENVLALSAVATLVVTYRRFHFSTTSYVLMTAFFCLHAIGAHYTYAQVPFGFWLQEWFGLSRNPFDRLVHFGYGLLLAYPLRELLVRLAGVRGFWSFYLPVSGMVAQSGLFEIVEAVVAQLVSPELGAAYLGTQGDEWDAQNDMIAASSGALLSMAIVLMSVRLGRSGDSGSRDQAGRPA
jgi:putative membrane protein